MTNPHPPYPSATVPEPKKRRGWLLTLLVALVSLFAGCAIGIATGDGGTTATSPTGSTQLGSTPGTPSGVDPNESDATPSGPLTEFSDGTYEVGTGDGQVAPGRYKSAGSSMCYWARLKKGNGEVGDISANNVGSGQMILNVSPSDGFVEVRGCTFTKAA